MRHRPLAALSLLAALVTPTRLLRAQVDGIGAVPCTVLRSAAHGVILLATRPRERGGAPCEMMQEYHDWMLRSDSLVLSPPGRGARFSGTEWDYASGAVRLGAPTAFVVVRGDSLTPSAPPRPRRLHLTAFAADVDQALDTLGSWYVLIDEDSTARRLFRPAVASRPWRASLREREVTVHLLGHADLDRVVVRRQLAEARALRVALGFDDPLPAARFVVGPARDSTLRMLGVLAQARPLYAMMVHPPLVVFAPLSAERGLDAHELVHVATFGRRGAVPGSVGEGFAMHHGGSHGRPFASAFCASRVLEALPALTAAQVDSAVRGGWWNDPRADVSGFALGHAIGWFIAQRGDSAWIFAEGEPVTDQDALGFLARRAGIPRDSALRATTDGFEARRASCRLSSRPGAPGASRRASP